MVKFAVILPVGPGPHELDRTADLLDSFRVHEPNVSWFVFIDDTEQDRQLAQIFQFPPTCQAVSLMNPRQGRGVGYRGGLCAAVLTALRWIHQQTDASFALKVDTDTLVIAPFADKIQGAIESLPEVGMLGAYDKTPNGAPRESPTWQRIFKKLSSPIARWSKPGRMMTNKPYHLALWGKSAKIRQHIQAALAQGYRFGEHCQGGAYAISAEMIKRMAAGGYLDDPLLWLHAPSGDDPMLGMYTRAVGLKMYNLVDRDQPFGIKFIGLAGTPEELLNRGYSLIHSVKDDPDFSEEAIRNFYQKNRATLTTSC